MIEKYESRLENLSSMIEREKQHRENLMKHSHEWELSSAEIRRLEDLYQAYHEFCNYVRITA